MTQEEALKSVAAMLSYNSFKALEDLKLLPNLAELTQDTLKRNLEIAEALGIADSYRRGARQLDVKI